MSYVLTNFNKINDGSSHYKLEIRKDTPPSMVCFDIVSSWYGTKLEKPLKTLVSIEPEEFESVKNFLLTLRG